MKRKRGIGERCGAIRMIFVMILSITIGHFTLPAKAAGFTELEDVYYMEYAKPLEISLVEDTESEEVSLEVAYVDETSAEYFDYAVSGTGIKVTAKKSGIGKIRVKKIGTEDYEDGEAKEVTIDIAKSELPISEITVASKEYDATKEIKSSDISFELTETELADADKVRVQEIKAGINLEMCYKNEIAASKAGSADYDVLKYEFTETVWSEKYILALDNAVVNAIAGKIIPYQIPIKIRNDNGAIPYTKFDWSAYKEKVSVVADMTEAQKQAIPGNAVAALAAIAEVTAADPLLAATADVGEYDLMIKPDRFVSEAGQYVRVVDTNYMFVYSIGYAEKIKIVAEKLTTDAWEFDESSTNAVLQNQKLYVNREDFTLKLHPVQTTFYDGVYTDVGGQAVNLTTVGLTAADIDTAAANESFTIDVYLKKGSNNKSETVSLKVYFDDKAPGVRMKVETSGVSFLEALKEIKFGIFDRTLLTANIQVEDQESGYEKWHYYVHKTDCDLNQSQAESVVSGLMAADWIMVTASDTPYDVLVKAAGKEDAGNYVLFVKAEDKVGNTQVYTSTGMIIDIEKPAVPRINLSGAKTGGIFCGDVIAEIEVSDPLQAVDGIADASASGIKTIKYEMIMEGKSYKIDASGNRAAISEPEILWSIAGEEFLLAELKGQGVIREQLKLKAADFESNDVAVHVIVEDHAGNTSEEMLEFKLDITPPAVQIEYQDKVSKPQNEIYFNKERSAVVTITEANFDSEKIKFRLKLEGEGSATYTLAELAAKLGSNISWQDSRAGDDKNDTRKRTNQAVITFRKDNRYEFEVASARDQAGNVFAKNDVEYKNKSGAFDQANQTFVIDQTAPEIRVSYRSDGNAFQVYKEEARRVYKNSAVTAKVAVNEHNFALNGVSVAGEVKLNVRDTNQKLAENKPTAAQYTAVIQSGKWLKQGDSQNINLDFKADANYGLQITYTDLAGNMATYKMDYFTVDKTRPEGTVTVGTIGTWSKFLSKITYGAFGNKKQKIRISGQDVTSSVASISYYKSKETLSRADLAKKTWKSGASFTQTPNQQFIVYAKIVDKAGNVEYINTNGVVLDNVKPGPAITITAAEPEHGIYNTDVPLTVQVEDKETGGTRSGLKSVSYEVYKDGMVTQSGNFDSSLGKATKRKQKISEKITVNANKNNSNFVKVVVTATDNAGNKATVTKPLKIDITNPSIRVSYNIDASVNGSYYNRERTATITITERNFSADEVSFQMNNSDGASPVISGWMGSADRAEATTHTCTVTFNGDGDYTVGLACTDLAGNRAVYGGADGSSGDRFTIDMTAPKVEVIYDNNDVKNGRYYNKKRQATVKITEHNFSAADVKVNIQARLGAKEIAVPKLGSFQTSGDVHTALIKYEADGDYTFDIEYRDRSGNSIGEMKKESFTIDTIAPEIILSGFERANKKTIVPMVQIEEINYSSQAVAIKMAGANKKEMEVSYQEASLEKFFEITNFSRDTSAAMDDVYTMLISTTDLAGNKTDEKAIFSVNRYGSTYEISSELEQLLTDYYTNEAKDLVIEECNTDRIEFLKITCSRNGEQMELTKDQHYTVAQKGDAASWKLYTYTIKKENFVMDGKYVVTVYSKDAAANTASNQEKGKSIEFVVDKTSPTLVITGIENRQQCRSASQNITIDAKDNIYLKNVRLEVSAPGAETAVYEFHEPQLQENYGVVTEAIHQANTWQTIKVTAMDMAGNVLEAKELEVLINPSLWVQYYRNKTLVFGSVALVALLTAGAVILIKKRKR